MFHEGFRDAAQQIFSAEVVRPQQVYANLTWQLPFAQGPGHTDVPAFRGVDRTEYPTQLLSVMGRSRLFEEHRVRIATAVAWFYEGRLRRTMSAYASSSMSKPASRSGMSSCGRTARASSRG